MLQSEDVELVNLAKTMFIEGKPKYKDYKLMSEMIDLLGTTPSDFIDNAHFRIKHLGLDLCKAGTSGDINKVQKQTPSIQKQENDD